MSDLQKRCLAIFYCKQVPGTSKQERIALEKEYGVCLRLFPMPCSGRLEPVHLLRALEEFADVAYLITCPDGACRYFEGNRRVKKRIERTKTIISDIGLEPERVGIIFGSKDNPQSLAEAAKEVLETASKIRPSPVIKTINRMG
jgi:coenzyme F420-reducing hydrogenase delta subunit